MRIIHTHTHTHLQNIFAELYATSISNNESESAVSLASDSCAPKKATVKHTGHDPEMVLLYLLI
jgi:hypothetical protein